MCDHPLPQLHKYLPFIMKYLTTHASSIVFDPYKTWEGVTKAYLTAQSIPITMEAPEPPTPVAKLMFVTFTPKSEHQDAPQSLLETEQPQKKRARIEILCTHPGCTNIHIGRGAAKPETYKCHEHRPQKAKLECASYGCTNVYCKPGKKPKKWFCQECNPHAPTSAEDECVVIETDTDDEF